MNSKNLFALLDKNENIEALVVGGAWGFALVGAAVLLPVTLVWLAVILMLKKKGDRDERPE
jgi:hypothetical protein